MVDDAIRHACECHDTTSTEGKRLSTCGNIFDVLSVFHRMLIAVVMSSFAAYGSFPLTEFVSPLARDISRYFAVFWDGMTLVALQQGQPKRRMSNMEAMVSPASQYSPHNFPVGR